MIRSIVLGAALVGLATSAAPARADDLGVGLFFGGGHHRHHECCDGGPAVAVGFGIDLDRLPRLRLPKPPRIHLPAVRVSVCEAPPAPPCEPCESFAPPPPPVPCEPCAAPEPCGERTFVCGHFVSHEQRVCEPAVYEDRTVPVFEERQVPVFETCSVPVYEDVCVPKLKKVCDPCTGERVKVKVGEKHERVRVGTREETRQVGVRTERVQTGERHERVCLRPATNRTVVRREWVPGHYEGVAVAAAPSGPAPRMAPAPSPYGSPADAPMGAPTEDDVPAGR